MNAKISQAILNLIATGKTLQEAYDAVLGAGAYDRMVSELYDSLRK